MVDLLPLEVKFGWDKNFYLHIQKHSAYLNSKLTFYKKLSKELSRRIFLEKVLSDSDRINYIIFTLPELNTYFVQFNRYQKRLYLDYPATNIYDSSFDRQMQVEKILIAEGYVFNPSNKDFSEKQYYFEAINGGKTLKAYFGNNFEEAADIAEKIFSEVYHSQNQLELNLM